MKQNVYYNTITVVRHGSTDWNVENRIQGWEETSINEDGIRHVNYLAKQLSSDYFDVILSSDLLRAQQTADILSRKFDIEVQYYSDLRERYWGNLQGLKEEDVQNSKMQSKDIEPFIAFVRRVFAIFQKIASGVLGKSILVITHGGPIGILANKYSNSKLNISEPLTIICENGKMIAISEFKPKWR